MSLAPPTIRVAAIDCGTNSIRLLVADVDPGSGRLVDVDRRMEIVRLGEGIDRSGEFSPAALARTFAACDRYAAVIGQHEAARVRFVATSASRDARNRDEFAAGVRARLGVDPEVISGQEEAALSFDGVTRELAGLATPYLVVDVGGGSSEFVLGTDGVEAAASVDMGCVRMTERHFHHDPPLPEEIEAARADVDALLDEVAARVPLAGAQTMVALAGTATTLAALALELPEYDPARIHLARVPASDLGAVTTQLLGMTHAERAALPALHPGRVDVIAAGALVLERAVARTRVGEVVISEHDILDGIAFSLAPPALS